MSKPHGIRIPGVLLDELKATEYNDDDRFATKKRKQNSQIGRKEKRKQQRMAKKQTRLGHKQEPETRGHSKAKSYKNTKKPSNLTEKKRQIAPAKAAKAAKGVGNPFSSDDELSSGDFEEFDDEDLDSEEWEQLRELEGADKEEEEEEEEEDREDDREDEKDFGQSASDSFDESEVAMTAEETMAALKRAKEKKSAAQPKQARAQQSESEEELDEELSEYDDLDSEEESDSQAMTVEETMAALKRAKEKKSAAQPKQARAQQSESEEELDGELSEYDDLDSEEESDSQAMTVEETNAALKRAKEKKLQQKHPNKVNSDDERNDRNSERVDESFSDKERPVSDGMTAEETMQALKRAKDKKRKHSKSHTTKDNQDENFATPALSPSELAQAQRDKWDYDYYAKKLGMKGNKKRLKAKDEFDAIGGLLEGLDFFENYSSDEAHSSSDESNEEQFSDGTKDEIELEEGSSDVGKAFSSDDEISEGDFDEFDEDDLDEDEWEQLRELEGGERPTKSSKKENPYVAPVSGTSAYVPPSLRKKNLESAESETTIEVRKKVKSSLNKLSESNITVIVSALNEIYDSYPRQLVNEALASQTLQIVAHRDKLLDSFVINYAAVVFSLWRLRGTEVGASFIQTWVERLLESYHNEQQRLENEKENANPVIASKECNNLVALLSYCYNFGLISCRLIYDLIKVLISTPNEFTTELLLRVISISGQLIRGDDPKALKEIIVELLNNVKTVQQSPRMKFLLEVMSDLKNNRLKPSLLALSHSGLKKQLSNFLSNTTTAANDPLQVGLDDIKNIDTRGKWWLVGASWKGNMDSAFESRNESKTGSEDATKSSILIEDNILDDIPDWSEIARSQKMNTEVRRAIFVSIMSAQDFLDAFTNIEKLNLKNKQSLEIPRVLVHCLTMEGTSGSYNPFYALLAVKLCQHNHHIAKAFQFMFWDMTKKFEHEEDSDEEGFASGEEMDENESLKKISCQGKFFGTLLAEEILKLDVFKHVPLMGGLNEDGTLFMEILLFQFLLSIGKKCEKKTKKGAQRVYTYEDGAFERLIEQGLKLENKSSIFMALKVFLGKKLKYHAYITEPKGSKGYERDKRRLDWAASRFSEVLADEIEPSE
ncbi:LAQU0S06e04412g1_1 [Lachancea quebecensis]|uniref:LAQU0S06e04412g1_1 n=1 Tax=Lachancea quebecensis TaxID=1654605 RepID=A0A0P1KSC7_9SACH|nr:LAQU0S06e04412g1_1 [Lachancea quebecensis]